LGIKCFYTNIFISDLNLNTLPAELKRTLS